MNSEIHTLGIVHDRTGEPPAGAAPSFASLQQSATLEFHATLQLLAERARFLTGAAGVAIALEQEGQFVYIAATGSMVPEIGATADITKYPLRKCIKTGEPVRLPLESSGQGSHPALAVAVLRNDVLRKEKIAGFFELTPDTSAFEDSDVEAVSRLGAMVATALDHLDAAEETARLIRSAQPEAPKAPATPLLWHAPEMAASGSAAPQGSPADFTADIHACTACGFPVSGVRTLCVECESHSGDPSFDPKSALQSHQRPGAELFATAKEETWISTHGYTIASLLVSALAIAIVYWLR